MYKCINCFKEQKEKNEGFCFVCGDNVEKIVSDIPVVEEPKVEEVVVKEIIVKEEKSKPSGKRGRR